MGLTNKKEEQLKKMPRIESKLFKSKDGKCVLKRAKFDDDKAAAKPTKPKAEKAP